MIVFYLICFIGGFSIVFIFTDFCFFFSQWLRRIHIGRWNNREEWQLAMNQKAQKWLERTPTVRIKDAKRLILWDIVCKKYQSDEIQSWQIAGLLLGTYPQKTEIYDKLNQKLFNQVIIYPDQILLAYALKKRKVLSGENEHKILSFLDKYHSSTIPYRDNLPNIRFVDTIGMICPFLALCGKESIAAKQIKEFDDVLLNHVFPPHAYNLNNKLPLGIYDWSRGIGWYILGIIETSYSGENKERIIRLAESLLPLQQEEGGFGCMFFNKNTRFESSGSALIGLLFVKAYAITQSEKYKIAAFAVEKALMRATQRSGAVDYSQGDTKGIGYYSTEFSTMPFALGITLYLSNELNKYA